jgi:hypothetical protein
MKKTAKPLRRFAPTPATILNARLFREWGYESTTEPTIYPYEPTKTRRAARTYNAVKISLCVFMVVVQN